MFKKASMTFGAVFLLLGLLGFVPGITSAGSDGMQLLFNFFMIDPLHNSVHIVSGLIGLAASMSQMYAKWYLVGFGVIYGLITIAGFIDPTLLGLMRVNMQDNYLHLVLAAALFGAGLFLKDDEIAGAKNIL